MYYLIIYLCNKRKDFYTQFSLNVQLKTVRDIKMYVMKLFYNAII